MTRWTMNVNVSSFHQLRHVSLKLPHICIVFNSFEEKQEFYVFLIHQ